MPGSDPPAGATWRQPYGSPGAAAGRRTAAPVRRLGRSVAATGLFAAACGGLVWVGLWLDRPPPVRVVIVAAGYEQNLAVPENAAGRRFAEQLAATAMNGPPASSLRTDSSGPTRFTSRTPWDIGLRGVREKVVLVALAAHGDSDADGPFLLTNDAAPGRVAGHRLRMTAVLERLAELPAGTKKVLLLDAAQAPAAPTVGLFANDFAAGLESIKEKIDEVPNLVVISAAGVGERSWPDGEASAFGRAVLDGLNGAADADGDRHITADELHKFATDRVKAAGRKFGAEQTALRYPAGAAGDRIAAQIIVATLPAAKAEPVVEAPKPPPSLRPVWDRYAEYAVRTPHPAGYDGHRWREYTAATLRYERLVRAGDTTGAAKLLEKLNAAEKQFDSDRTSQDRSAGNTLARVQPPAVPVRAAFDAAWAAPEADAEKAFKKLLTAAPSDAVGWLALERAKADPAANLARAADMVRRLEARGKPRPSELALLVALAEQLPADAAKTRPESVTLALQTRQTGERLAAADPRVAGWIAESVKAADAERVLGEDHVFASDAADVAVGVAALKSAANKYAAGQADADRLLAAFTARDKLFAVLPFFAEWTALDPVRLDREPFPGSATERLLDLWRQAHALDAKLRAGRGEMGSIVGAATAAAAGLENLAAAAAAEAEGLLPIPPATMPAAVARLAVARLLTVPTLAGETREKLLAVADRLAADPGGAEPTTANDPAPFRRALLALAAFGRDAFDGAQPANADSYSTVRERLASAPDRAAAIRSAGAAVNDRFAALPAGILSAFDRYAAADSLANNATAATTADVQARAAPAGLTLPEPAPAAFLRQHQRREQFLRLTQRELAQAWAGAAELGRLYLADAEANDSPDAVRTAAAKLRGSLERPAAITIVPPPRSIIIDPGPVPLAGEIRTAGEGVFPGRVAVWADAGPRTLVTTAGSQPYSVTVLSPAVGVSPAVRGFFRGRVLNQPAPLEIYPEADVTTVSAPPPAGANVAVRASTDLASRYGNGVGAVAVVVDCSGSSAAPGGGKGGDSRIAASIRAATGLIAGLPRDVPVTVWAFGQAGDAGKASEAELTVRRVFGPVRTDPTDSSIASRINSALSDLQPYNQSPMYRAVLKAREDVFSSDGYRAVVLISDCHDNRIQADKDLNPEKKPGPALVRQRFTDAVALHVLAPPPESDEEQAGQSELQATNEKLPLPGLFLPVAKADELTTFLRAALSPRLRCTLAANGQSASLDVGLGGTADRWPAGRFPAGKYDLSADRLRGTDTLLTLRDGENLLLTLTDGGVGPTFRRRPFADDLPGKPSVETDRGDWRLTVLQNKLEPDGGLRMLVVLEPTDRPASEPVARPADVWFDLGTDLAPVFPPSVKWAPAYGYPAPAWEITSPKWPNAAATGAPARPVLRAFWTTDAPAKAAAEVPLTKLLAATGPTTVRVGGDDVAIEPVKMVASGSGPAVSVRLSFPPGRPVVARLDGVPDDGYERRVYVRGGRSVAVCRTTASDPGPAIVRLIAADEFRAAARRLELRTLPAPDPNDARPRPVPAGK